MDPNETLKMIRTEVAQLAAIDHYHPLPELIQALDEWLTRGGFLPAEWERAADTTVLGNTYDV